MKVKDLFRGRVLGLWRWILEGFIGAYMGLHRAYFFRLVCE